MRGFIERTSVNCGDSA